MTVFAWTWLSIQLSLPLQCLAIWGRWRSHLCVNLFMLIKCQMVWCWTLRGWWILVKKDRKDLPLLKLLVIKRSVQATPVQELFSFWIKSLKAHVFSFSSIININMMHHFLLSRRFTLAVHIRNKNTVLTSLTFILNSTNSCVLLQVAFFQSTGRTEHCLLLWLLTVTCKGRTGAVLCAMIIVSRMRRQILLGCANVTETQWERSQPLFWRVIFRMLSCDYVFLKLRVFKSWGGTLVIIWKTNVKLLMKILAVVISSWLACKSILKVTVLITWRPCQIMWLLIPRPRKRSLLMLLILRVTTVTHICLKLLLIMTQDRVIVQWWLHLMARRMWWWHSFKLITSGWRNRRLSLRRAVVIKTGDRMKWGVPTDPRAWNPLFLPELVRVGAIWTRGRWQSWIFFRWLVCLACIICFIWCAC